MFIEKLNKNTISFLRNAMNNTPEALAEVLRRGKDDVVSDCAAKNANCPPRAAMEWRIVTGKIQREDPNDPDIIIEYDEQPVDEDLEKFRKMIEGGSSNFKKFAEREITLKMVQDPNCNPEILAEVMRRGKDDWVSRYASLNENCPSEALTEVLRKGKDDVVSDCAVLNKNCPSETLAEVLRRGKDDWVSCYAASNKNCPPEALTEVLRRGNNDNVSIYAASNPNCPPEALAEVLRRGKNDGASWCAAQNKNCPPEALVEVLRRRKDDDISWLASRNTNCPPRAAIEWMMATGKIQREDPNDPNIIVEYDEKPVDEDLEKLRKMVENKCSPSLKV